MTSKRPERPIGGEMTLDANAFSGTGGFDLPDFGAPCRLVCDTGRSALRLALRQTRRHTSSARIWLPDYICPSVPAACRAEGFAVMYFPDRPALVSLDQPPLVASGDVVLYAHYFGRVNKAFDAWLQTMKGSRDWILIEDGVQAAYSEGIGLRGDFMIASLRKWWPAPDGAVLCSGKALDDMPLMAADEQFVGMRTAAKLLRGGNAPADEFLSLIEATEELLDQAPPRSISWTSRHLLNRCDPIPMTKARRTNWQSLQRTISVPLLVHAGISPLFSTLEPGEVPLAFPIKVANGRDKLRAYLAERRIYCPIHWILRDTESCTPNSRALSAELLSLPIDQRYDVNDMNRMVSALLEYCK